MGLCVAIHAAGVSVALRWMPRDVGLYARTWRWTGLFICLAGWMVVLHLVQITAWAAVYVWRQALPDWPSALYFSAVTYTTTGYGDLVLPPEWRLAGAVESLTGILMCGLSTGFFFAVVTRIFTSLQAKP
jgi:SNF family Na+-dependent transporter